MTTLMPGHAPLKFHALANLFPMLDDVSRASFRASLAERQNNPIWLHRGMVLDGRNRYRELTELGKPVRYRIFEGTDREAFDFVMAENLERRHLSESQRAMVAAKAATLKLGSNQYQQAAPIGGPSLFSEEARLDPPASSVISQSDAADLLNVGRRSVQRAVVVIEKGAPELQEAVQAGSIAVSAAADIAALPVEEQRKIIAQADPRAVKDVAKQNRKEKTKETRQKWLNAQAAPSTMELFTGRKATVLYVDVPQKFQTFSDETGTEKSAGNHYRLETFEALANMREKVLLLANDDCVLAMWGWASSLLDQIDLMAEWGFAQMRRRDEAGRLLRGPDGMVLPPAGEGRYRSHLIWAKRNASGTPHRGTGFWFIDCHELLLVGARGSVRAPEMGTQSLSIFDAPVGDHSEKPAGIRDLLDQYFPGVPKTELFGRVNDVAAFKAKYPTWEVMGNETRAPEQQSLGIGDGENAEEQVA